MRCRRRTWKLECQQHGTACVNNTTACRAGRPRHASLKHTTRIEHGRRVWGYRSREQHAIGESRAGARIVRDQLNTSMRL